MSSSENKVFSQLRLKRLCAFIIDICVVSLIAYVVYAYFRLPDYFSVKLLMDEVNRSTAGSAEMTAMANNALALFNVAYFQTLLIWLAYEIISQILFKGATLGKLAMRIRVVPLNPARGKALHYLLMAARSVLKVLSAYIFNGIPLFLAVIMIFANKQSQSGYDLIVKSSVKAIEERTQKPVKESSVQLGEN